MLKISLIFFFTDGWELTKIQLKVWQEYIFWYHVIFVIEDTNELSFKIHLPVILSNLNFFDVSNISAFIRKIRNKIKFVVKKRSADAARELAVGVVIKDVGPLCEKENISLEWLHNPTPLKKHVHVNKGLMLELRRVRMRHNLNLKKASLWIKYLCEAKKKTCVFTVTRPTLILLATLCIFTQNSDNHFCCLTNSNVLFIQLLAFCRN